MAISKKQENTLKKHSKHHSKKHMNEMKTTMSKGTSFDKAHKIAMKKVGLARGGLSKAAGYSPVMGNNKFGYPSGGIPVKKKGKV
jgi:hypothetical protein|tara:strand:- start:357 stop:611 length:255 start_codon:yes stop_codon:yes gene_type:complete